MHFCLRSMFTIQINFLSNLKIYSFSMESDYLLKYPGVTITKDNDGPHQQLHRRRTCR